VGDARKSRFDTVVVPFIADGLTLARALTGNGADAEDVVQESCLRAYRGLDGFAGANARAWVLAIVRNTAYTWIRNNRPTHVVTISDLSVEERGRAEDGADLSTNQVSAEAELIARADAVRLQHAIDALPTEFCEALVLRDIQGLHYQEIAEVTGVPIGTVMSRLARARRRLTDTLKAND
jgi:RNA polymerase sigma factor (sigma-70 family)